MQQLITNTFVLVAPDCKVSAGTIPPPRGGKPSVASLQYELLSGRPYELTLEDLMYEVHLRRKELTPAQAKRQEARIREKLFDKPYPCMRASPLPKTYGWGVHHDADGRIAIFGVESPKYKKLAVRKEGLSVISAMRSKRAD